MTDQPPSLELSHVALYLPHRLAESLGDRFEPVPEPPVPAGPSNGPLVKSLLSIREVALAGNNVWRIEPTSLVPWVERFTDGPATREVLLARWGLFWPVHGDVVS